MGEAGFLLYTPKTNVAPENGRNSKFGDSELGNHDLRVHVCGNFKGMKVIL